MSKLFRTYEVGSLPKLPSVVLALRGQPPSEHDNYHAFDTANRFGVDSFGAREILERQMNNQEKLSSKDKAILADFNALLYLRIQESLGLDYVYDGEARRKEMYQHVATRIDGFEKTSEMIRSRGPDSWRMGICVGEPRLKENSLDDLILREFDFVKSHAVKPAKVPMDDPYMIAVMSDNKDYMEKLKSQYENDPSKLRYEAKREFTLALARNVIRPQVEAIAKRGAEWIQLDIPAATLDVGHMPIVVDGVNEVVKGIDKVKFSLHICYPRRISLTGKNGYELLFPHALNLNKNVNHFSLELANADNYENDLAVFAKHRDERKFEIGVGVVDITLEKQQKDVIETPEIVKNRILRAAKTLKDPSLVYVAPDCGLRQLSLDRCMRLYEIIIEGAELARNG